MAMTKGKTSWISVIFLLGATINSCRGFVGICTHPLSSKINVAPTPLARMLASTSAEKSSNDEEAGMHPIQDVAELTDTEWKRVVSRFPEVETYDVLSSQVCLTKLKDRLSLSPMDLKKKIILRLPQVLGYDFENDIGPSLGLIQKVLSMDDEELRQLVLKCPQIIGLDFEQDVWPNVLSLQDRLSLDLEGIKAEILKKPASLQLAVRGGAKRSKDK